VLHGVPLLYPSRQSIISWLASQPMRPITGSQQY